MIFSEMTGFHSLIPLFVQRLHKFIYLHETASGQMSYYTVIIAARVSDSKVDLLAFINRSVSITKGYFSFIRINFIFS